MAPRKKNLKKKETVKVPYAVLYTHDTAEGKPRKSPEPALEPESERETREPAHSKQVPSFAKKK